MKNIINLLYFILKNEINAVHLKFALYATFKPSLNAGITLQTPLLQKATLNEPYITDIRWDVTLKESQLNPTIFYQDGVLIILDPKST